MSDPSTHRVKSSFNGRHILESVQIVGEFGALEAWVVNDILASHLFPRRARTLFLRMLGLDVSLGAFLGAEVVIRSPALQIGSGSTVNYRCVFDNRAPVRIGAGCGVGIGVSFITSTHDMSDPDCRAGRGSILPISVGDGVWIGSGATLLAGVNVGHGAVIAAHAVVTADVPGHWLYGGIPAKPIRELNQTGRLT